MSVSTGRSRAPPATSPYPAVPVARLEIQIEIEIEIEKGTFQREQAALPR